MRRPLRIPWWAVPLAIFALTRLASGLLILWLARGQISASEIPPNQPMPTFVDPASYFHVIANWDGQWYREIAAHGYPDALPTRHGEVQQNAWAFYPLFPALVRILTTLGLPFGFAASVITLGCAAAAMCLVYRMLLERSGKFTAALTVLAMCVSPAAPILQSAYTEGLALLLLMVAFWGMHRNRFTVFGVAGCLLALTRPIALPVAMVAVLTYVVRRRGPSAFPASERRGLVTSGLVVLLATLIWPAAVGVATGDPTAYLKTQAAWARVASDGGRPWALTILSNATQASDVFLLVGLLTLICWRAPSWPLALRLWPVPYAVFLLAATPPTASILRFLVLAGPPWWPAPSWSTRVESPRLRTALVTSIVVAGLLLQWWWLRSYFIVDVASRGHP